MFDWPMILTCFLVQLFQSNYYNKDSGIFQSRMSFVNPYSQINNPSPNNAPQKLSMLYIEQAYFHRIEIKTISSMYKLSVRLKKPIILSLHSLPVLKYITDHSQSLNSILQMQNLHEIRISVPGYGIFNQKYQLDRIANLFFILSDYCQHVAVSVKKIVLEFPGWRTFTNQVITNIFKFIAKCQVLEEFSLNINHAMNLTTPKSPSEQQYTQSDLQNKAISKQLQEDAFYGYKMFKVQQFQLLMKFICSYLSKKTITKIQLRFGAWEAVTNEIVEILNQSIRKIYDKMKNLKVLKLDLCGWGAGEYESEDKQIKIQILEKLFRTIEEFDGESSELLEIDMRYWPKKYKISKYKDRFLYLSGGNKRKDDPTSTFGMWSLTGTNFFGSQMKSKLMNKMKVQIKD